MRIIFLSIFVGLTAPAAAFSEPLKLSEYLTGIDRTEVRFAGRIRYSSRDNSFTFYDEDRTHFGVTVDAGRDVREQIEKECDHSSLMFAYSDLCVISGIGTVEIRGSRVYVSIEQVDQLSR